MAERGNSVHIIGVGSAEDWRAGRGSVFYSEDRNGEKVMPVFTTLEKLEEYVRTNLGVPGGHMDMLESIPTSHLEPLTQGRFHSMSLDAKGLGRAAAMIEADYLVRDPCPGEEQDILRLS